MEGLKLLYPDDIPFVGVSADEAKQTHTKPQRRAFELDLGGPDAISIGVSYRDAQEIKRTASHSQN